jgi:hypothetical protein
MIFRRANEKVGINLDKLNSIHIEEGDPQLVRSDDLLLHFICECSDEDCEARIPMKLSDYQKIHLNRGSFIIKPEHQVKAIEKVVLNKTNYNVVEKNNYTTEPGKELNNTDTNKA